MSKSAIAILVFTLFVVCQGMLVPDVCPCNSFTFEKSCSSYGNCLWSSGSCSRPSSCSVFNSSASCPSSECWWNSTACVNFNSGLCSNLTTTSCTSYVGCYLDLANKTCGSISTNGCSGLSTD